MSEHWRPLDDLTPIGRVVLLYVRGVGIVEASRGKHCPWERTDSTGDPIRQEDVTHWAPVPRWPEETKR